MRQLRHTVVLPVCLLFGGIASMGSAFATESEAAPEAASSEAESLSYSQVLFDTPRLVVDGLDPVFPDFPETLQVDPDADLLRRIGEIGRYQVSIAEREASGGPWNPALIEDLAAMGELYQAQGAHAEAVDVFTRAMHVSRINHGLDSLDQIPVVQGLIDSHIAQRNWGQADQYQTYLYYVQSKAYGPNDPRMIPVLGSLARWNLQVFHLGYGEAVGLRLANAYSLFKAASQIVSVHFGVDDERYVSYLRDMAGSAYLVSRNQNLIEEASRPEYRSVQAMYADRMRQVDPIHAQGYREGEDALKAVVDYYLGKPDQVEALARARTELGDWYLVFERRRAAADQYRLAYELLESLPDGEAKVYEVFGNIVPLPAFADPLAGTNLSFAEVSESQPLRSGYADVVIELNNFGLVADLQILGLEAEEDERIETLLRRKVRSSMFRPQIVAGEMVRSSDNRFRYRYWY